MIMTPDETPVVEETTTWETTPAVEWAPELDSDWNVVETPTEAVDTTENPEADSAELEARVEETTPVEEVIETPAAPNAAVDLAPKVITQSRGPARPVQEIVRQEMPVDDRFVTDETRKMSAGGLPIAE